MRHKLRLSQEDFASSYGIPLDVVRAWELGESTPSQIEQAYLRLIEREPERSKLLPA